MIQASKRHLFAKFFFKFKFYANFQKNKRHISHGGLYLGEH